MSVTRVLINLTPIRLFRAFRYLIDAARSRVRGGLTSYACVFHEKIVKKRRIQLDGAEVIMFNQLLGVKKFIWLLKEILP